MNKLPFNKNFEGAILSKYTLAIQPEFGSYFETHFFVVAGVVTAINGLGVASREANELERSVELYIIWDKILG